MDLLDLEIKDCRVSSDFKDKSIKLWDVSVLANYVSLADYFDELIRTAFKVENSLNFKKGLELLDDYASLKSDPDFRETILYYDDDRLVFSSEFSPFNEYVFSKKGFRAIITKGWKEGVVFSYLRWENCIRLYSPSQGKGLGKIYLEDDLISKMNIFIERYSKLHNGKTFIFHDYDKLYVGK